MLFKLESKPEHSNCPRCQSTDTIQYLYHDTRYCDNCDKKYDREDEVCLREQKMDEAKWAV